MEWYSIDRIEGGFAVVEENDKSMKNIPLTELPEGVGEGDVLLLESGKYTIDEEETLRRKDAVKELQKKLFKK